MSFLIGLGSNTVANVLFWALLGALFWVVSTVVARRFSQFFGLNRTARVAVYLSNLWKPESSPSGRSEGYTISLHELRAAQSVDKLFGSAPFRLPDLVRGLVDAIWLRHQVQCVTDVCPLRAEDADLGRNLIIVGSSARNSVRARYVRAGLPSVILTREDGDPLSAIQSASITVLSEGGGNEITLDNWNFAILEKCYDPERGITLIFCLGPRADGSWAATEYLVRNWRRLAREFSGNDFAICLCFPYTDKYLEEYVEPSRRLSLKGGR